MVWKWVIHWPGIFRVSAFLLQRWSTERTHGRDDIAVAVFWGHCWILWPGQKGTKEGQEGE